MFADNHLTRKTPPSYADGVYMLAGQNRPSPRKLSQIFMKGEDGLGSSRNRTALLAFFGKCDQLSHISEELPY
jgi:dual oxidase